MDSAPKKQESKSSKSTLLRQRAKYMLAIAGIDAELAECEDRAAPSNMWSSDDRPVGVTKRTFNETCRSGRVLGAEKDGHVWTCSRSAWTAARSKRPTKARIAPPVSTDNLEAEAAAALAAVGLRSTRRAS